MAAWLYFIGAGCLFAGTIINLVVHP